MKFRPLHDRVLIRRVEEEETVRGGIIIPDTAKEKPQQGEAVAVGNGKVLDNGSRVALEVKSGDRVLFGKYSGTGGTAPSVAPTTGSAMKAATCSAPCMRIRRSRYSAQ